MAPDQLKEITDRLDALILAISLDKDMKQTEKIRMLSERGYASGRIAMVLGTTPNTVAVALNRIAKEKKNKKASKAQ
ncbi:MAG TPA: hypothetical protein VNE86_03390 [Nitrososphaerales archaeon]|nr:hypothetical protein [Nitrososphaerales archaeon]